MTNCKWLAASAALAAGEYLAASFPGLCALEALGWLIAGLVILYGYGLGLRFWPYVLLAILGLALGMRAARTEADAYRNQPWLRGRERRARVEMSASHDWRSRVRRDLARRVTIGLETQPEMAALNRAILLGERRTMSRRTRKLFVDSGAIHIFAISGLHIMAISTVLVWLARLALCVPSRWAGVVALPVLWTYVAVIGSPPSALRAAMMASLGALAPVNWRRPNGLVAWAITFLAVHLCRPELIVNVGSVLSFAVMLAIQLTGDALRDVGRRWWSDGVMTVAAWAVGVPIAAHVFARVTPSGLLANLVLIGVAKLTVYLGALGMVASVVSGHLAAHLNAASALCTRLMVNGCECLSALPGGSLAVRPWTHWECAAWYAGLLTLALGLRYWFRRHHWWGGV